MRYCPESASAGRDSIWGPKKKLFGRHVVSQGSLQNKQKFSLLSLVERIIFIGRTKYIKYTETQWKYFLQTTVCGYHMTAI